MTVSPAEVLAFWRNAGPDKWFARDAAFDAACREGFEAAHHAAARRELDGWAETADGALALVLLLDQFPRNLWRGSAHAYATDPLARLFADAAVAKGFDRACDPALRVFFYMPFEHSERPEDQDRCVGMMEALGDPELLKWARVHQEVIARFGRFPHRNAALGRETTAEERAFLEGGGFSA